MKYSFREGQWFDVRKMTGWQKQWCLDNLDWVSLVGETFCPKGGQHDLAFYNNYGKFKRFGVSYKLYLKPEDEVTFEDFYRDEDEPELTRSCYILKEGDYLDLHKLSDWQKNYLQNNFPCYNEETFDRDSHVYWGAEEDGGGEFIGSWMPMEDEISFNTLFN